MTSGEIVRFLLGHPLNQSGKVSALKRFVRWQIASRVMDGPIAFPFVEDTKLFARRGSTGATGNWYCGLHEVDDMAFVLHVLRNNDLFVDIGANIGSYSILSSVTGANVVAVEPIPSTFFNLEQNICLNRLEGIIGSDCIGVSASGGVLRFTSGRDCVNHVLADGEEATDAIEVTVTTLDQLLGDRKPAVIKIDVEGHEKSVLMGGGEVLNNPELLAVIMETNGSGARYGTEDDELIRIMENFGFSRTGYDPFNRRLIEPSEREGGNTIFVRDLKAVERRVATARKYRLVNGQI